MDALRALMLDQVRAHLVVETVVRALRHQQVVDRAEDGAEAVGVGDPPRRVARLRMIFHRLLRAVDRTFEQAAIVDAGEGAERGAVERMCLRLVRAGQPDAREHAGRAFVHAEQRERVVVTPFEEGNYGAFGWLHITVQISRAYSRIVRSDENQPTRATLRTVEATHASRSFQRVSTARWAVA